MKKSMFSQAKEVSEVPGVCAALSYEHVFSCTVITCSSMSGSLCSAKVLLRSYCNITTLRTFFQILFQKITLMVFLLVSLMCNTYTTIFMVLIEINAIRRQKLLINQQWPVPYIIT